MTAKTVDEYIAGFPEDVQTILEKVRATIRKALPKCEETIRYGIPAFKAGGKTILYFAGYKSHVGVYPVTPDVKAHFKKELAGIKGGKGTIRFPLDRAIPYALIARIAKYKLSNNESPQRRRGRSESSSSL